MSNDRKIRVLKELPDGDYIIECSCYSERRRQNGNRAGKPRHLFTVAPTKSLAMEWFWNHDHTITDGRDVPWNPAL